MERITNSNTGQGFPLTPSSKQLVRSDNNMENFNGLLERGMMFVTELEGWLTVDTWAGLGQTAGYFIFSGGAGGHHSNWKSK